MFSTIAVTPAFIASEENESNLIAMAMISRIGIETRIKIKASIRSTMGFAM
jgi:hypothetical protein